MITLASFCVFICDIKIEIFSRNIIFLLDNGERKNDREAISDVPTRVCKDQHTKAKVLLGAKRIYPN